MERDRGFNFKLLVPPRVNTGQVSTVRPQEILENCSDFVNTLQGYNKGFEKEQSMSFPNRNMVAPAQSARQDFSKMKVVPPMEKCENNCNPGQLYSKLFDEVEKIKCWKVKVDSETVQKETRLQENKRTIETQRKAIQELQFGNESLSVKLEEQISENEDLKSKNNATRNLCNILKDTFERTVEKMHLFESEREETHHLLMGNSGTIQKLIEAYESLHIRAEADQQEMQKVKESLLQYEDLKEKYHQEYNMKGKEVAALQTQIKEKENELQKLLLDLHETQKHCKQLQEATNEQHELLKSSKNEQKSLLQKLQTAEQRCTETEKNREAIAATLEQSLEEYAEMVKNKEQILQEFSRVKNQQAEKLEEIQITSRELQESLSLGRQRAQELEDKLVENNKELEMRNTLLGESMEQSAKKDGQIKILEDELVKQSQTVESMKGRIDVTEVRLEELTAELSKTTEEAQLLKIKVQELEGQLCIEIKQNKEHTFQMEQLKKDITQHKIKYKELLSNFNELQSEKTAIQQQFESESSHLKAIEVSENKAVKLTRDIQRLEEENQCLREEVNSVKTKTHEKYLETETLQKKTDENCEHLLESISEKEKQIKSVETKNRMLKKQIEKKNLKSSQLEDVISSLHKESKNLKRLNEEEQQKLLKDLESKSTFAAELENEVQKLRLTAAEAVTSKKDTELKCQHKIADMVALMEKHKSQYDRMVEEKDAELDENKKKEMEAVSQMKSLELDLATHKTDNDQLKKQLKTEITEKEKVERELTDLKKEMSSMKMTQLPEARNKQSPVSKSKQERYLRTPKDSLSNRHMFDFSLVKKTPGYSKDDGNTAVKKRKKSEILNEDLKTPKSVTNRIGGTSKIKSYRIRTPPSGEKTARWGKSTIDLDPRSDSSDQNDLLTFASTLAPSNSTSHSKLNIPQKSTVTHKSPGNSLKLAAMKRIRDAGWTAVTGSDKKKKTANEKIFA
ncbi:synaptonemal complex protein 1 isoform X2 [Centropristis striata]|uniref:synaptonemal complex protein 1 isoform X2 n=1 Tax=Centropristis striata TaxID=184440 RepID=UPI0027E11DB6|nr:synaptonemal complex protein 1 isoform X2 [Centropristis striata]